VKVGVITGTGTYALPGFEGHLETVGTPWGSAGVTVGSIGEIEVAHISRHGEGHRRLSTQVEHRANIGALRRLAVDCVISVTVCGAVDLSVPLGSLIVFDDLHFLSNRLPDGSLCTIYTHAGEAQRGHWIFGGPFSERLRRQLLAACTEAGIPARDGGCYGHVDGPRFNTRAEIAGLAQCGVTAVSQTAAAEAVLCGEARLPFALLGYATDYANGVGQEPTPVEELLRLVDASQHVFASVLEAVLPRLPDAGLDAAGTVYRFEE
jgi:5'-methylthioadenosine phosphorylase